MASNESTVILKSPNDWDAWNKQFRAEARRKDLLDLVDGTEDYLTKPPAPELRRFLPPGVQTRAAATSTTADLTPEGRASYQLAYTIYKDQRDQCERQRDALDKLQTWMTKTIAASYVETCFDYEENIDVWYSKLKEQVGSDETTIKREIKDNYKRSIKPLSKIPKDLELWITNWEQAIAKGLERNLPFATSVDDWFDDFLTAVRLIHPMWVSAYELNKSNEVKDGSLSYRTVANDFRTQAKKVADARPGRVGRGAFPIFAGKGTEDETDVSNSEAEAKTKKTKKTGKQPQKGKRQRTQTTDQTTSSLPGRTQCRACKQGHDLRACYYLFSNKAPSWFKPNQQVKELVEQNLKNDSSLAEEVKRLQKSMDKTKPGTQNNED